MTVSGKGEFREDFSYYYYFYLLKLFEKKASMSFSEFVDTQVIGTVTSTYYTYLSAMLAITATTHTDFDILKDVLHALAQLSSQLEEIKILGCDPYQQKELVKSVKLWKKTNGKGTVK
eukprot:TRINITY_DN15937_c0_g1_i1.p1 TRINITY_DN15937_c0_g1~~TRINITY_DN15937_c0_g1_i1.p1  ORF type:complete len:118 (-),score=26.56 TRINITY_DN15937_c0_g1_i1:131-484(-)